jgi:hypothetical protein
MLHMETSVNLTKDDIKRVGSWQSNTMERYLSYLNHYKQHKSMEYFYGDKVVVNREGNYKGCTGTFVCVRVANGEAFALLEMSPTPDIATKIEMFGFDEIAKLVKPSIGDTAVVALLQEDHESLLGDLDELSQQVKEMAERVRHFSLK